MLKPLGPPLHCDADGEPDCRHVKGVAEPWIWVYVILKKWPELNT